jgi:drug/metabolite transporter (DMT)-like permease
MLSLSEFLTEERVSFLNFITRNKTHSMRFKADLTLLIVSTFWGSAFVAQRIAGLMGSVYLFNGARYLFAAVVVLPFALRADRISNSRDQVADRGNLIYQWERYQWMLIAGFVLFLGRAFQQLGVVDTTAGNAGFITILYVVLVPIVLFIIWREQAHWISIVAVLLSQFKEWNLGGKMDGTHLVEGR